MGQGSVEGHRVWEKTPPLPVTKGHRCLASNPDSHIYISEGHTDAISSLQASVSTAVKIDFTFFTLRGLLGTLSPNVMSGCIHPPFDLPG